MVRFFLKWVVFFVFALSLQGVTAPLCEARKPGDGYAGFAPIEGSEAYKRFLMRPKTDLSKLLYLLDRFEKSNLIIIYNGYRYTTGFGANFGRWFVTRYYRNQTPDEWILQWCNRSVPSGDLIWVELSDKSVRLGREVLQEEIIALDKVEKIREETAKKNPAKENPPAKKPEEGKAPEPVKPAVTEKK